MDPHVDSGPMRKSLKRMARILRRTDSVPRGDLAAADAVIVSYPKCGRTWLRTMLGHVVAEHAGLPTDDVAAQLDLFALTAPGPQYAGPRIYVTHDAQPHYRRAEDLRWSKARYRRADVVFLARDPRDVIVSLYFDRAKRRSNAKHYAGTLSEFLNEEAGGIETLIAFYNSWAEQAHVPRSFLLVRYEELRADTAAELRRILDFIGLGAVDDDVVRRAVDASRFERMRALEAAGQVSDYKLRPGDADDPESFKTRRGVVGGYTEYLTPAEAEHLDERLQSLAPVFGYGRPWPAAAPTPPQ
jgi:hypothetical protein